MTGRFDGRKLRKLREAQIDSATGRTWSQTEMAFRLRELGSSVTSQTITKWERGPDDRLKVVPRSENLLLLARLFGVSMEAFFED